ncbi:MAG: diacylglycerol kinase family protein [Verrucomicrobiota bacterium]
MNPATPCVIFNPSARGEKARRFLSHPDILRGHCVVLATSAGGHARDLAAQAVRNGFQTLIAAGGDGTANEVLNGIADVPGGLASVRLGILPLGTVNVFARELRLPLDPARAWNVLQHGRERSVDLGRAEFCSAAGPRRRCFLQLAGAGLDSRAIELTEWEVKKKIGPLAYLCAALQALRQSHPIVTVQAAASFSGDWVAVGNGRFYGGPFAVFPAARLDDGLLHVCVFPKVSLARSPALLAGFLFGCLPRLCGVSRFAAPTAKLSSPDRVLLQLDGENVGQLPATLSVERRALRVIVP